MQTNLLLPLAAAVLGVGCTMTPSQGESQAATGPAAIGPSAVQGGSPADLSGSWTWSRVERLTMPPFVAEQVAGVMPEGPVTHARCEGSGTMTLVQSDATFTGTATQDTHICETAGGQLFQDPAASAPIVVADGVITGTSIRFLFNGPIPAPCPHHAVISSVENGIAVALTGKGRCYVPGHPHAEGPLVLDPPPAGTSMTTEWMATRP